ncbi:MAG TPA: hypothetical protein VMY78_14760 [Solirubrobacteraceae bacterium]|nr:hypothetical protein [Solirubrobacteraceae bacterium]
MFPSLLAEIVRRRLWPIPVLAILVALAAPILFLEPVSDGAPAADVAAPAPAQAADLPARAQRLLATTEAAGRSGRATGSARDPFAAPAGHGGSAKPASSGTAVETTGDGAAQGGSGAGVTSTDPIPVVIQNADGSTPSGATGTTTVPPGPVVTRTRAAGDAAVDVRFGRQVDSRLHRSIPRLQTFLIHGKLAAVFVKYSPSRRKATFAVAPNVLVGGPVSCRRVENVCRYVDIPAGSFARLTMLTPSKTVVRRRLDVVRIDLHSGGDATTATAAKAAGERACLLRKLKAMDPRDPPIDRDACEG